MVMVVSLSQSKAKSIVNLFNACSASCEICAVKLYLTESQPLIIIGAYRPPNRDALYAQNLCNAINDISVRNPNSFICCTGDFNLPDIDWDIESVSRH